MILYIENPKDYTKKLLDLINEYGKVPRYKINIHKLVAFLYAINELTERETKKIISFNIVPKMLPRNTFNQRSKRHVVEFFFFFLQIQISRSIHQVQGLEELTSLKFQ